MGRLRIKICGITSEADAREAVRLGADAIGLNFEPTSPRSVRPEVAGRILRELPPFIEPVGLFVNQPLREVFEVLNRLGAVRTIQWHGDQPELADVYPFRLILAFQVRDAQGLTRVTRYLDMAGQMDRLPAAVLIDGYAPGRYGGTGNTAPWDLVAEYPSPVPLILAGGLTPDNVADAVLTVRPYGVDVAGGVERSPGVKDPEKMRRFIDKAREADAI
jgi:phosphoribosylanthranilate isomerase